MIEKTTIKISKELAGRLKRLMDVGDSYEKVIWRLLECYERSQKR